MDQIPDQSLPDRKFKVAELGHDTVPITAGFAVLVTEPANSNAGKIVNTQVRETEIGHAILDAID